MTKDTSTDAPIEGKRIDFRIVFGEKLLREKGGIDAIVGCAERELRQFLAEHPRTD